MVYRQSNGFYSWIIRFEVSYNDTSNAVISTYSDTSSAVISTYNDISNVFICAYKAYTTTLECVDNSLCMCIQVYYKYIIIVFKQYHDL